MELRIDLSNFNLPSLTTTCPHCQKTIKAVILSEYDFYTELYHDAPECKKEWTFSSYEQCRMAQKAKYERLAYKINCEGEGSFMRNFADYGVTFCTFGIITILTGGVGGVLTLGAAKLAGRGMRSYAKKDQLRDAFYESFSIKEFFSNLSQHHLDEGFLHESKQQLEILHAKMSDTNCYVG